MIELIVAAQITSNHVCWGDFGNGIIDLTYMCGGSQVQFSPTQNESEFLQVYSRLNSDSSYPDSQAIADGYLYCDLASRLSQFELAEWRVEQYSTAIQQDTLQDHWVAVSVASLQHLCSD